MFLWLICGIRLKPSVFFYYVDIINYNGFKTYNLELSIYTRANKIP